MTGAAPDTLDGARSVWLAGGDDEASLQAALASDADAVFADFEDIVPPAKKATARDVVTRLFTQASGKQLRIVRINAADTPYQADDLAALERIPVDALIVPKATPETVEGLGSDGTDLIALIESGQGVRLAYEIGSLPRVKAFMIGAGDLATDLRIERTPDALHYTRSKLVVDAAAAQIRAPFDVPSASVGDVLEAECNYARALGLRGKLCTRAEQVEVINRVFA